MGILWSLATPVLSSPDEIAHFAKAVGQYHGQVLGVHEEGQRHPVFHLPDGMEYSPAMQCFWTREEIPADCAPEIGDSSGGDWFASWVASYNPLYYYLVGWPSLFLTGNTVLIAMRIASSLVGAALFAWAAQIGMATRQRRWIPAGLAFIASPMIVYMSASVNPNGLEIASAVLLWLALPRLLETFDEESSVGTPRWVLWSAVTVGSILLANARATGPLWLLIVAALGLLMVGWKNALRMIGNRGTYPWLALIMVGGVFSLVWTLRGGSLSGQAGVSDAPLVNGTFLEGAAYMLKATPVYFQQALGYFGWFDTPLPGIPFWLIIAAISLLVVLGFMATSRRSVVVLATICAAAILAPVLVQAYAVGQTGIIWQGRYGLFLYIGVILAAAHQLSIDPLGRVNFLSRRLTALIVTLVGAFAFFAFVFVLYRYGVGIGATFGEFWSSPKWQPAMGWKTLSALYALVIGIFVAWIWLIAPPSRAGADIPGGAGDEASELEPGSTAA